MLPPYPGWLHNGWIIGTNVDGEALAVGSADGTAWLGRLNRYTNTWCHVRQALQSEIDSYDNDFLDIVGAMGIDTRTTPPAQWRLL